MSEKIPVVAVIPNYNMAESLDKLLDQVCDGGYDEVYVLDDNSSDTSVEVASKHKRAKVIVGQENLGPGANRNRIIPVLGHESLIHFLDSDVSLTSEGNPDKCRSLFGSSDDLGLVGGLITLPDQTPWMFNYGPAFSFYSQVGGTIHAYAYGLSKPIPMLAKYTKWWRKEFAEPTEKPKSKEVYWVGEANMIIPSRIFKEIGGFDPYMRYHEAQDLAIKLHRKGYRVEFSPEVSVSHPYIKVPMEPHKKRDMKKAERILRKNYGYHFKNVT